MSCLSCPRILNWICQWLILEPSTKALALPHPAGAWLLSKSYNFAVIRRWGRAVFWQMLCKQYRRTINPDLWLQEVTFCFLTKKTILYSNLTLQHWICFLFLNTYFQYLEVPGGFLLYVYATIKTKMTLLPPKKNNPTGNIYKYTLQLFLFLSVQLWAKRSPFPEIIIVHSIIQSAPIALRIRVSVGAFTHLTLWGC